MKSYIHNIKIQKQPIKNTPAVCVKGLDPKILINSRQFIEEISFLNLKNVNKKIDDANKNLKIFELINFIINYSPYYPLIIGRI